MTFATIVVPAFNAEAVLAETLHALLVQSHRAFEVIVVDDGSTDGTAALASSFDDQRIRLVQQGNRGLAGARNTGIAAARGSVIGFCDAGDLWTPDKLASHVFHLETCPEVGVSFSGAALIGKDGRRLRRVHRPRLQGLTAAHVFRRDPIGNGSTPVVRRAVFNAIAHTPPHESGREWYFDETFRQSGDIECWLRIALSTNWDFEGVPGLLTRHRVAAGVSANGDGAFCAWERMVTKLTPLQPGFFAAHAPAARAYRLRDLARRAIGALDRDRARGLTRDWLAASRRPLWEEPLTSAATLVAGAALVVLGPCLLRRVMPALRC